MRFIVMIRSTETGYSADVPDLPGCVSVARTVKGTRRMITEAITYHLELMQESGEVIPVPSQSFAFVIDPETAEEYCTWVDVEVAPAVAKQAQGK